jgi:hypothetical protein
MEQGDERAAASKPNGGLAGRVAAADDSDARDSDELRLGRSSSMKMLVPSNSTKRSTASRRYCAPLASRTARARIC